MAETLAASSATRGTSCHVSWFILSSSYTAWSPWSAARTWGPRGVRVAEGGREGGSRLQETFDRRLSGTFSSTGGAPELDGETGNAREPERPSKERDRPLAPPWSRPPPPAAQEQESQGHRGGLPGSARCRSGAPRAAAGAFATRAGPPTQTQHRERRLVWPQAARG